MTEYVTKEDVIELLTIENCDKYCHAQMCKFCEYMIDDIDAMKSADVQEKRYCRMIPLEPDLRNCTNVFICTNCHQHIHLGFIRQKYSGSFCIECGAEVMDSDKDKDNNVRNLTDEETSIYESWIESEAKDTSENIMDGATNG